MDLSVNDPDAVFVLVDADTFTPIDMPFVVVSMVTHVLNIQ